MTQSAAKAAADEALRAAGEDNLRDESPPRRLTPQQDRHTIIYNDPPPWR